MSEDVITDTDRRAALEAAEAKALALFDAIETGGLIAPGRSEREVEADIFALAEAQFGVVQHWHRRIVRAGANTLTTAADYPDERTIEPDDTVYVDLGPVFEAWEADIGRTYAVGGDAQKHLEEAAAGHVKVPALADLVEAPKELDEAIRNPELQQRPLHAFGGE